MSNPLSRAQLLAAHCAPLEGGSALSPSSIAAQLRSVPDWTLADGAIERSFAFENYYRTLAFVNGIAWMIHAEDHHPDLKVSYDHCVVRFSTHSVKGISQNDFVCAAKCDAIFTGNSTDVT